MLVGAGILGLHPLYYALGQELPAKHMAFLSGSLAAAGWFVVGEVQKMMGAHIKATGDYTPGFVVAGLAPLVALAAGSGGSQRTIRVAANCAAAEHSTPAFPRLRCLCG